jgi:glutaredoxin
MPQVILYTAATCSDCRLTKQFLLARGVEIREVNIRAGSWAEAVVLPAIGGRWRVPTIEVDGGFIAGSPFDAHRLAEALGVPLDPSA